MSALPDNQSPSNRWHFTWGTTLLHSCSAVRNLYFFRSAKTIYRVKKLNSTERGAFFRHFWVCQWSPLCMRTKLVSFFIFSPELSNQNRINHYRARNRTFDENSFLVSSESSIWNGSMGENRQKEIRSEVGLKCHQSCLVALAFCTKLYIKLAFSLCSFSQFSFPFNFRTAEALVLKFGPLPLYHLFSNILLAIFDICFRSRVIHRFVPKNGPNLTCGRVF